jgi:hypothetical protein
MPSAFNVLCFVLFAFCVIVGTMSLCTYSGLWLLRHQLRYFVCLTITGDLMSMYVYMVSRGLHIAMLRC